MPEQQDQKATQVRPFTTFNFRVELQLPEKDGYICSAEFSECDGIEVSMQPKTYQEGGNYTTTYQLVGPLNYGQLSLKRGMTTSRDLWTWMKLVTTPDTYGQRTDAIVVMLSSSLRPVTAFLLKRCLPVKLKAPALNAKDGTIAIEEIQIAYERFELIEE